jgi:hypothetical protein
MKPDIVRFVLLLLLAIIMLRPLPTLAQESGAFISGAYLMKLCERDEGGMEVVEGGHATCQSYIAGIIDYHKLLRSLGTAPSIDFCVSNQIPLRGLQGVVHDYLKRNVHHDAFNAAPAVVLALFESFPCGPIKKP